MDAIASSIMIHPAAYVAPGARIGAGCRIGPGCVISADAVLGEDVQLASHVVIDGRVTLGDGVKVSPFVTIGLPPQDVKYRGEPASVEIGARTQIREHVTIHRGSVGGHGVTRIGADCLLMCVVHVGHDCLIGNGVVLVNNTMLAGHVEIGDHAVISGGVAVQQFVRIGHMAMIAGMSGVERNVLPYARAKGFRAKHYGLNTIAMRRRLGLSKDRVMAMARVVHDLYRGGRPEDNVEALAALHADDALVLEILDFARSRGRHGLIPFGRSSPEDEDSGEAA